jgi:hypothetical protein
MPPLTRIIPALVHIQAHLDEDLSLDALAGHVGLSKYHFHELFQSATGETPKSYVERLRLEWAAVQLRIRRVAVVDVALECGYRNHETVSRARAVSWSVHGDPHDATDPVSLEQLRCSREGVYRYGVMRKGATPKTSNLSVPPPDPRLTDPSLSDSR